MSGPPRPLDPVRSIRVKLGLLVGVSVIVTALLATLAAAGGVPWWLSLPVAVGVALAITQLLATGMTAPLREMTAAARAMSRGDYSVRVLATSTDEVGELARAFSAMADQLEDTDRRRRELIATVAHELRTPMAGLRAQLDNMADGVTPVDLDLLGGQVDRLSGLVEDLLDLSRLDAGVTRLEVTTGAVADLIAEARRAVEHTGRDVKYDVAIRPDDLQVTGDHARLVQVITNLLDNAARHSPPDGQVRIRAEDTPDGWTLEVYDDGPGIPVGRRAAIFERFGTSDVAGGGTGLGLAISRWIATLHGGTLIAVDPLPGTEGGRFRLSMPTVPPSDADPHPQPVQPLPLGVPMTTTEPIAAAAPQQRPQQRMLLSASEAGPRPLLVLAAAAVGVLGAVLLPMREVGLAYTVCLLAAVAVIARGAWHRRDWFSSTCVALAGCFALMPILRAAEWLTVLGILVSLLLLLAGVTKARTIFDLVVSAVAAGFTPITGLPWLGRSVAAVRGAGAGAIPILRTVLVSVTVFLIFGALLASGDAILGNWLGALIPDLGSSDLVFRMFLGCAIFGVVLTAVLVALDPAPVPHLGGPRLLSRRYEWLAPVLVIDALFVMFLAAQATAFFGGEAYLEQTTGLTYAQYVHQGFGQLTVATMLTLVVIGLTVPRAARATAVDRRWLRAAVGLLCLLTLTVVASALYRMSLYQDAYGLTVLRLLVLTFEVWLGVVVVMVMVAGIRLRGGWLARSGLLTGAGAILVLAALNPEGLVARQNLERAEQGKERDDYYLSSLSADAVPALADSGIDTAVCPQDRLGVDDDLWEWNLGRFLAREALGEKAIARGCDETASIPTPE